MNNCKQYNKKNYEIIISYGSHANGTSTKLIDNLVLTLKDSIGFIGQFKLSMISLDYGLSHYLGPQEMLITQSL